MDLKQNDNLLNELPNDDDIHNDTGEHGDKPTTNPGGEAGWSSLASLVLRGEISESLEGAMANVSAIANGVASSYSSMPKTSDLFSSYLGTIPKLPAIRHNSEIPTLNIPDNLLLQVSEILTSFSSRISQLFDAGEHLKTMSDSFLEAIRPSLDLIGRRLDSIDTDGVWSKSRDAAEQWGMHGWAIFDNMPWNLIINCPETYAEANRVCRRYALQQLPELRQAITDSARKKKDAVEMFELFDEGHYKACAMMACSLIDGELFNWKIAQTGNRRVSSSPKNLEAGADIRTAQSAAISIISIIEAYNTSSKRAAEASIGLSRAS
ncbi:MAG: hypothetical protein QM302_03965 [Acidobacteriota bacterium]|nr:hypothetical protein [Acidobacteriota bacterium]